MKTQSPTFLLPDPVGAAPGVLSAGAGGARGLDRKTALCLSGLTFALRGQKQTLRRTGRAASQQAPVRAVSPFCPHLSAARRRPSARRTHAAASCDRDRFSVTARSGSELRLVCAHLCLSIASHRPSSGLRFPCRHSV